VGRQGNASPIKPERGFLDPVGGTLLQDSDSHHHQTHQNGANHEDEDVQLVGSFIRLANNIKTCVKI